MTTENIKELEEQMAKNHEELTKIIDNQKDVIDELVAKGFNKEKLPTYVMCFDKDVKDSKETTQIIVGTGGSVISIIIELIKEMNIPPHILLMGGLLGGLLNDR